MGTNFEILDNYRAKNPSKSHHSYSSVSTYDYCPRRYYLERVEKWKDRNLEESAPAAFGVALERSLQAAHVFASANGDESCQSQRTVEEGLREFNRQWEPFESAQLRYNRFDKNWNDMQSMGQNFVRMFCAAWPPPGFQMKADWQVLYRREFEKSDFIGIADIVAYRDDDTPVVLDIKTSNRNMPRNLSLDRQLRTYAWLSGIWEAGFLWFHRVANTISPRAEVSLVGKDGLVYDVGMAKKVIGREDGKKIWAVATESNGEADVLESDIIVQHLIFDIAQISEAEVGSCASINLSLMERVDHSFALVPAIGGFDSFPQNSGLRMPSEKCPPCPMLGICADDPKLVEGRLFREGDVKIKQEGAEEDGDDW